MLSSLVLHEGSWRFHLLCIGHERFEDLSLGQWVGRLESAKKDNNSTIQMFSLSLVEHTLRLPPHLLNLSLEKAIRRELEELFLDKVYFLQFFFSFLFTCPVSCTSSHGLWDWLTWAKFVQRWSPSWGSACLFMTSGALMVASSFQGMVPRRTRYWAHKFLP